MFFVKSKVIETFNLGQFLEILAKVSDPVVSWSPTSSAAFTAAESSTVLVMSNKEEINVRLVFCFTSPKHQSGANLVCLGSN